MTKPPPLEQPPVSPEADVVDLAAADEVHKPYVPSSTELTELTPGSILLGVLLGFVFAASSVYLALKVGLTVSASIPIAVLSITIFRYVSKAFGKRPATILQNNMVQTTGSAGESIAAGVVFTLPALLLLGYALPWSKVAAIAVVGGILGVLLMIPLRRSLIVQEHGKLKYPEGTACAEVLIVGEERGVQARTVFMGFGLGALYKLLNAGLKLWAEVPRHAFQRLVPGGRPELLGEIRAEISPELTGVGYIVGTRIAGYLFAGGFLSYFVLIPAIKLFGGGLTAPVFPADQLIADMDATAVRANYVFYIGAGAVTAAGIISLVRALPTIARALASGLRQFRPGAAAVRVRRTDRDLPMGLVVAGAVAMALAMMLLPQIGINLLGAVLAVVFAFLFVTVASRLSGLIGNSSNPISGMTVATVLLTALIFLGVGWTGIEHRVLALSIGGVVCIAAAVAGATSQDLKTGFLVGATPARQQIGLLFGVVTSALVIGATIQFLNEGKTTIVEKSYRDVTVGNLESGTRRGPDGVDYRVGHLYERTGDAPAGTYLVDESGAIRYVVDPGIGGRETKNWDGREVEKLESPKSQIMALVVDGILTQKLPWGFILIGVFIAVVVEILGIPSLPFATGVYLPISTSATMFMGGIVRYLIERRLPPERRNTAETDSGPGVLFSSGLIAGGAIMGVALAALAAQRLDTALAVGVGLGPITRNGWLAMALYVLLLALPLYLVARRGTRS
jgi:putative OPT family oligopeptide transporter